MAQDIDKLQIEINAKANNASDAIDKLILKLDKLTISLGNINGNNLNGLANGVQMLGNAMQTMNTIKTADFTRLAKNLTKLGSINVSALNSAASSMSHLTMAFNSLGTVSANAQAVGDMAKNIAKLGNKSVQTAITNIPQLATAMNNLMTTLSRSPRVSQNVIQMTNALANLASQGSRVGSASNIIVRGLSRTSSSANTAKKSFGGLASAIGKFYATYFLVIRGIKGLWNSIKESSNYVETLNYFNQAFLQVANKADLSSFKSLGYDSAEIYANSFSERAKELTSKLTGFEIDASGRFSRTNTPSLGLDPNKTLNYQAMFAQMSSSIGVTSENALKLSNALTMIGADLASVKNMEFDTVWTDMASGLAGMSRTLDKYGVNIRNVNLQQKLSELGINANIQALNQNDKAILRTIILLDSTRYAWGDLARTINQPANQLRVLQANFSNLARTLGSLFIPIVSKVIPYINALVTALQRLFSWIAGLFGINLGDFVGSIGSAEVDLGDIADDAESTADGLGSAAKEAEKLKRSLRGYDELNVVPEKTDTGSGGGGSTGLGNMDMTGLNAALDEILSEYQKAWNDAFEAMNQNANKFADNVSKAFKQGGLQSVGEYIGKELTNALNSIPWGKIYEGAKTFGKGLANFLNGLISPELFGAVGKTIASALNTAIYAALSFGQTFDFKNLGASIASAINTFFATFDFAALAKTINVWVKGLFDALVTAIANIDWLQIYDKIIEFLSNLDIGTIAIIIGALSIKNIGKAIIAEGVISWIGTTLSKLIAGVPIILSNVKILAGGGLIAETGFVTKLANALALAAGNAGTLHEALVVTFGAVATTIAGVVTVVGGALLSIVNLMSMLKDGFNWLKEALMLLGIAITAVGAVILGAPVAVAAVVAGVIAAVSTLAVAIKDNWSYITKAFQDAGNSIDKTLSNIKKLITDKFGEASDFISTTWNRIFEFLSGIWQEIFGTISKNVDEISKKLSGTWDEIKKTIAEKWDNIKLTINGKWEDIKKSASTKFNEVKDNIIKPMTEAKTKAEDIFGKIKNAIETKINLAKDAVKNAIDKIKGFFNFEWSLPKLKLPHISMTGSFSLNPPKVPKFDIDWYANGGVFNSPSIIGVGERGTEAVMPLEHNTGWIDSLAAQINQKSSTDNSEYILSRILNVLEMVYEKDQRIEVNGKNIFDVVRNEAQKYKKQTGHAF